MKQNKSNIRKSWRPFVSAIAIATAFVAMSGVGVSAQTQQVGSQNKPRPNIVLVHGAWANGSSWNGVRARLQADGFTVYVPPNPLRGLAFDSACVASFLSCDGYQSSS
jgi:pimeloyl-ACP methyl ester carboxylesterase